MIINLKSCYHDLIESTVDLWFGWLLECNQMWNFGKPIVMVKSRRNIMRWERENDHNSHCLVFSCHQLFLCLASFVIQQRTKKPIWHISSHLHSLFSLGHTLVPCEFSCSLLLLFPGYLVLLGKSYVIIWNDTIWKFGFSSELCFSVLLCMSFHSL